MFGAWPNNVVIRTTDSRPSQPSHLTPVQETEETSELVESDQDAEGDDNHLLALANSTPLPSSRRKRKADSSAQENRIDDLQRVLEADRRFYQQQEDKRQKLQGDIQLQIARIHAESQERLMESQRRFMEQQLQALQQFMGSIIHSLHRPH